MTLLDKYPVSNNDVLIRYGASHIMRKAWFNFKNVRGYMAPKNFADALRSSWHSLRLQIARELEAAEKLANAAKRYKGPRGEYSPLNPHMNGRFMGRGARGNCEYVSVAAGR